MFNTVFLLLLALVWQYWSCLQSNTNPEVHIGRVFCICTFVLDDLFMSCLSVTLSSLPYVLHRDIRPKLVRRSWNRVDKIDPNALTVHGQLKSINVLLVLTYKAHQVIITYSVFYILGIFWVLDIQLWKDRVKIHYTSHYTDFP